MGVGVKRRGGGWVGGGRAVEWVGVAGGKGAGEQGVGGVGVKRRGGGGGGGCAGEQGLGGGVVPI